MSSPQPFLKSERGLRSLALCRDKDQSSSIISGSAGLLTILLVIAVLCILWNWNKWKKRRDPYLRVTNMFFLTLLRSSQRAKNIYDLLPWTQEELGRHHSRSIRIFSTESLFSRNSDRPCSEHVPSQAGNVLRVHRAQTHTVRIYDNATWPQMCENLTPSAQYVNVRAPGDHPSNSSEDSIDYVNVPTAEEIAETLASPNNPPGNLFMLPIAPELEFTEEGDKGCINVSDCTSFWSLGTENNDPLSDEEGSSQTSDDYVNMAKLDLGATQGKQPWVSFQYSRDYENVSPADPNGSQCQTEEVTTSNTNHEEDRTDGQGTHIQFAMQSRRFLDLGDYVIYQPSAQSEDSQVKHEEEMSDEDSNDYNTVLAAKLGGRDSGQEPNTQIHGSFLIKKDPPTHPAGKPHIV
ncbi:lymphocyte transmembrane adapter 1 isoform X2 [Artibeus jamaicensis]|uniref:lymphocyte transmembrane adapter 1 isoform X2 n=1 Tax=Artibeus jamaicensis TaxID=9417 RepID=UPI00235A6330|nr:lymphocyte transmembrane adapter 1 isoform X2 [Artibeus jamaicensis]